MYAATYWFFRLTSTGTFASFARVNDSISLVDDGHLTSTGVVRDFDASGNLISTGCFIHTAYRLADSEQ
jgi:transcriptional regulator GlxA family with amidase domain